MRMSTARDWWRKSCLWWEEGPTDAPDGILVIYIAVMSKDLLCFAFLPRHVIAFGVSTTTHDRFHLSTTRPPLQVLSISIPMTDGATTVTDVATVVWIHCTEYLGLITAAEMGFHGQLML
jgi:hypothetical protein